MVTEEQLQKPIVEQGEYKQDGDSMYKLGIHPHMYKPYEFFQHQCEILWSSEEGLKILEDWLERWKNKLTKLANENLALICDLSGGMDTRVNLALILLAGIKDKVLFYCKNPEKILEENSKGANYYTCPKMSEDYEIASKIAKHYNLKFSSSSYNMLKLPRIMGICSTFKINPSCEHYYTDIDKYGPFKEAVDRWKNEHQDSDELDLYQMTLEIIGYNWHNYPKLDGIKGYKVKNIVAPLADQELHRLKSKGYSLYLYFMKKYMPELLEFEVQGRGVIK